MALNISNDMLIRIFYSVFKDVSIFYYVSFLKEANEGMSIHYYKPLT